ncbi:MAG: cysteine--tRNA ligase [Thermoplasmataceae archaeon]
MYIKDTMKGKTLFKEIHPGRVNMFVCGPTVYDIPHIGNARVYVFFDMVAKYLRIKGLSVFYLQNITDIDDKILKKAVENGENYQNVAERYYSVYMDIVRKLGIDSVNLYARATLYMEEIINQIERLIGKGYVYETEDGLYFRIRNFPDYGKLSGQKIEQVEPGSRVEVNENKEDPGDFVVWKKQKPGEPSWDSPWGQGRPGWHIEDTAITECYFGPEYDIHGGGSDLIFPHHEGEIAQMRGISGLPILVNYWMHLGMLNVNGDKMSKSLKNFITIDEVMKLYSKEQIRFFLLNASYRNTMIYSDSAMKESSEALKKIQNAFDRLKGLYGNTGSGKPENSSIKKNLMRYLENDFDTRGFFAEILTMVSEINRRFDSINEREGVEYLEIFRWLNSFMGVLNEESSCSIPSKLIDDLVDLRGDLRAEKMFAISDKVRDILAENGIMVEDGEKGTGWRKA